MRAQTEPMDHVGHQLLESRVLDAGNAFGALEIGRGGVAAFLPLARIVDQELGHLAQRAAFLAVVDDDAKPAGLGAARAFFNAMDEIGTAVQMSEPNTSDPLHSSCTRQVIACADRELFHVAEQIDGRAPDRRQEHLQIEPGHELRKHAGGLLE